MLGALLNYAQLQAAWLASAQLQGASLVGAQLQGATLGYAQLQGATLDRARLQGASLHHARLQGASLNSARLQGASLNGAQLDTVDMRFGDYWRSNLTDSELASLLSDAACWAPQERTSAGSFPWDAVRYRNLRQSVEKLVPIGDRRDEALDSIAALDPDLATTMTKYIHGQTDRARVLRASVRPEIYREVLKGSLKSLICSSGEASVHVVRGLRRNGRVRALGTSALKWVDAIVQPQCAGGAGLTDVDKASLQAVADETVKEAIAEQSRNKPSLPKKPSLCAATFLSSR